MIYVLYVLHVITCLFLIMVVLLQQGKGADLSVFGGGTTQTAFGARGAATILHKLTVGFFVLFIVTTMSIGILQRSRQGSSIMTGVDDAAADTVAEPPAPPPAPDGEAPQTAPGGEAVGPSEEGVPEAASGAEGGAAELPE